MGLIDGVQNDALNDLLLFIIHREGMLGREMQDLHHQFQLLSFQRDPTKGEGLLFAVVDGVGLIGKRDANISLSNGLIVEKALSVEEKVQNIAVLLGCEHAVGPSLFIAAHHNVEAGISVSGMVNAIHEGLTATVAVGEGKIGSEFFFPVLIWRWQDVPVINFTHR
jgi:hypothetical protein